jgi:hypothetical protein
VFTPACAAYVGVVIRQVSEGDGDVAKSFLGKDSRVAGNSILVAAVQDRRGKNEGVVALNNTGCHNADHVEAANERDWLAMHTQPAREFYNRNVRVCH